MARSGGVHNRELLDALEVLEPQPISGTAWHATWATRDPLVGNDAGGRWHPINSFEALYTSLEADGSLAEMYYHLSRAPVFASSNMRLHRLRVQTKKTSWLPDMKSLIRLGIDEGKFSSLGHARCQEIGAAAHFLEFDGVVVPSARWPCLNLVLFMDRLDLGNSLSVLDTNEINWLAWKQKRAFDHGQ
jgi:RES domain